MKKILIILVFLILTSCSTTYSHRSGNNSNLEADTRYCSSQSKLVAPVYLCRNPLMCAPDEIGTVWSSIAQNEAAYDQCMLSKGYAPN